MVPKNQHGRRYVNSVAIAYVIVTLVTLISLASESPKLPMAFLIALVSPDFWLLIGTGFVIFVCAMYTLLLGAYIAAVLKPSKGLGVWRGVLAAIACSAFYFCVFFVLMLSGLRH